MKLALVQQQASENMTQNLRRGVTAVREAADKGAELILFPELAFSRFFPQHRRIDVPSPKAEEIPGPTTEIFCELAQELGLVIVINLYEAADNKTYDSSPVIDRDGEILGVTRMVHIMQSPCFHEQDYYDPGDTGAPVYDTALGRIGVAICYDRHYPEYMRALGVKKADLVLVPQAGAVNEWPDGLYEAELQVASMQNGYFCALANRVGREECLTFAGESFVTDPKGQVISRAPVGEDYILLVEVDLRESADCPARRHFLKDRRPEVYPL